LYKEAGLNLENEKGSSLIEVVAALYIVALIVMVVFSTSASSSLWINGARDETLVSAYAASIIDILRNNSRQLHQQIKTDDPWTAVDENPGDDVLTFYLDGEEISMDAPEGINTSIRVSSFDDNSYYDGVSADGINTLGTGDNAKPILFYGSLIEVCIELQWASGSGNYKLSTILGLK